MREENLARLVKDMPDAEVRAARNDAAVGLSLLRPGSPMHGPAQAYLCLLDTELAQRHDAGQGPAPAPRN
jgi:hypothetical protein